MSEWIKCSEELPMYFKSVLTACRYTDATWGVKTGFMDEDHEWWIEGAVWTPTHWMPLPYPPKEES